MADNETFGQRLRRLRKKQGFTQAELAYQIDVHEMTIRRWETGTRQLENINDIKKLAATLHVTEDELLNGVPEQNAWALHVEMGNNKEDFLDMRNLAVKPVSAIITDGESGFLKIGGAYSLWQDDTAFNKIIRDLKRLRSAVIANGMALGGIKEEEKGKEKK